MPFGQGQYVLPAPSSLDSSTLPTLFRVGESLAAAPFGGDRSLAEVPFGGDRSLAEAPFNDAQARDGHGPEQ
jgi:hypothetical protein